MSKQVLYRKYRSRSLDEVVGQKHITDTLESALKSNQLSHAYLFVGPRGVGKTSVARILAYEANGISYSDTGHIDIIEIDAASNRRIDEIRELREKIHIAPIDAKYKVYIIDEVHMLTREAFNALLKTLEEPPEHAIFILATTESHKIPETVISRTQRFVFRPIDNFSMTKHLKNIAEKEGLEVDQAALELISEYGDGSFRDSISLLDQLSAQSVTINQELVEGFLGYSSQETIELIIDCLEKGNIRCVNDQLQSLLRSGTQAFVIATQIIDYLLKQTPTQSRLELIESLLGVQASAKPHIALEIALIKQALKNHTDTEDNPADNASIAKPEPASNTDKEVNNSTEEVADTQSHQTVVDKPTPQPITEKHWREILTGMKTNSYPLYTVLRMAEVSAHDDELVLKFQFDFHARRFENKQNLAKLREITSEVIRSNPEIAILVDKDARPSAQDIVEPIEDDDTDPDISAIIDTIGGGEVVEL